MTDQFEQDPPADLKPIEVKASAAPAALSRVAQVGLSVGAGILVSHLIPSETIQALVAAPAIAGAAALASGVSGLVWAVWQTITSHRQKVALAAAAPDSVAVIK